MALAALCVVAGLAAFYYFQDLPGVVRVLAVLAGLAAAVFVFWMTAPGKEFYVYAQDSVAETRKVVWPTRKETLQTTGSGLRFRHHDGAVPLGGRREPAVGCQEADRAGGMMSKKWYVVHAYSGFEKSVQRALLDRIQRVGHAGSVRPDPGTGRGSGRDEERSEEHQRTQVLPGIRSRRDGNDRRTRGIW